MQSEERTSASLRPMRDWSDLTIRRFALATTPVPAPTTMEDVLFTLERVASSVTSPTRPTQDFVASPTPLALKLIPSELTLVTV